MSSSRVHLLLLSFSATPRTAGAEPISRGERASLSHVREYLFSDRGKAPPRNCLRVTKKETVSTIPASRPVAVRMGDGFPEQFLLASASENTLPDKGGVVIRQWQRGEGNAPVLGESTTVDVARVLDLRALLAEFGPLAF